MSQAAYDLSRSTKTARLLSAANSDNATSVKASRALVFSITGWNAGTATYLKLYDKASAPASTDTSRQTQYLAANARFQINFTAPVEFSTGLGYRLTTGVADNDTGAVAAAAVLGLNIDYS